MKKQTRRTEQTLYALACSIEWMDDTSSYTAWDQVQPDHASLARTGPLNIVGMGGSSEESSEWPWWLCELASVLVDVALSLLFS